MAGRVDPAMAEIAAAGDFIRVGHTGMSFGGSLRSQCAGRTQIAPRR